MSPSLDAGNGSTAIWQRLLTHLCVQTAEQGGLRIYARLPMESEELKVFKNVGFMAYGQLEVFQLANSVNRTDVKPKLQLRPQKSSDGWGLQKLYAALTPRAVQNVEGLGQGQWDLTRRRWLEQGLRSGYVWELEGELLAAIHIRAGKRGYWIRTMLHPSALEEAEALCRAALVLTATNLQLPVYFAFTQYESGWRHILPALDFQPLTSQTLTVKSMAVRIREKAPGLLPVLEATPTEGAAPIITRTELKQPPPLGGAKPADDVRKRRGAKILTSML